MDAPILEGQIGDAGKYDVTFKTGTLRVEASYASGVTAGLFVEVSSDAVLDALAKAIPGTVDDAVIALIKAALKAI